ncbi:MAG: hypothetical protein HRT66_11520 [Flavobacteriaceae bacterium]|nr:hypothetical protein [Flavobacteriaceae bacterium]
MNRIKLLSLAGLLTLSAFYFMSFKNLEGNRYTGNIDFDNIQKVYKENVLPMYFTYKSEMPKEVKVDYNDESINAGASFDYIEVSKGLADHADVFVQAFALTHEASHIITMEQMEIFGIEGGIPEGQNINSYQKAELLADLMATHLLGANYYDVMPSFIERVEEETVECKGYTIFGKGDFLHPSAEIRIKHIKEYATKISMTEIDDLEALFKEYFIYIVNLDESELDESELDE